MRNFQFSIFNFQLKSLLLHRNLDKNGLFEKNSWLYGHGVHADSV